jgi:hypothetical protein
LVVYLWGETTGRKRNVEGTGSVSKQTVIT